MKKLNAWSILVIILILIFAGASANDIVGAYQEQTARDFIENELLPFLFDDNHERETILFAAELNISNGPPYARLYGERGMFGQLVAAESSDYKETNYKLDVEKYLPIVDDIRDEVVRLLLNPNRTPEGNDPEPGDKCTGCTTFGYDEYTDVLYLDYESGTWKRWTGDILGVYIHHTTEFGGLERRRVIGAEAPLKFAVLWIEWKKD